MATSAKLDNFAFIYKHLLKNYEYQTSQSDLPDDLDLGNLIAVDGEFMGLNIRRDPLCLIQISTGNSDTYYST